MLAIDYTPAVAAEAQRERCDAIIAYHPPIFDPLKRLTAGHPIFDAIRRGVAVYALTPRWTWPPVEPTTCSRTPSAWPRETSRCFNSTCRPGRALQIGRLRSRNASQPSAAPPSTPAPDASAIILRAVFAPRGRAHFLATPALARRSARPVVSNKRRKSAWKPCFPFHDTRGGVEKPKRIRSGRDLGRCRHRQGLHCLRS